MTSETVAEPKPEKPARSGDERSLIMQWLFGKDSTTVTLFVALVMIGYDKGVIQPARDVAIEERHTKQLEAVAEKFDRDQTRDSDFLKSIMFNRQQQAQTQSMNIGQPDREKLIREASNQFITEWTNANVRGDQSGHRDANGGSGGSGSGIRHSDGRGDDRPGSDFSSPERDQSAQHGKVDAPAPVLTSEGQDQ